MTYWDASPFSSVFPISENPLAVVTCLIIKIYVPTHINFILNKKDMVKLIRSLTHSLSSSLQHLGILRKRKSQPYVLFQHSTSCVLKLQRKGKLLQLLALWSCTNHCCIYSDSENWTTEKMHITGSFIYKKIRQRNKDTGKYSQKKKLLHKAA